MSLTALPRRKLATALTYRLLITDGHSSHVNMDFLEWCDQHRIIIAVFLPHSMVAAAFGRVALRPSLNGMLKSVYPVDSRIQCLHIDTKGPERLSDFSCYLIK